MIKYIIGLPIVLVALILPATPAHARGNITVSGTTVGQTITISGSMSGTELCTPIKDRQIAKVTFSSLGGNEQGSALDLSSAVITASLNGQTISGASSFSAPLPGAQSIHLTPNSPFSYDGSGTVSVKVTGAKVKLAAKAEPIILLKSTSSPLGDCSYGQSKGGSVISFTASANVTNPSPTPVTTTAPTISPTPESTVSPGTNTPITPSEAINNPSQPTLFLKIFNSLRSFLARFFR